MWIPLADKNAAVAVIAVIGDQWAGGSRSPSAMGSAGASPAVTRLAGRSGQSASSADRACPNRYIKQKRARRARSTLSQGNGNQGHQSAAGAPFSNFYFPISTSLPSAPREHQHGERAGEPCRCLGHGSQCQINVAIPSQVKVPVYPAFRIVHMASLPGSEARPVMILS